MPLVTLNGTAERTSETPEAGRPLASQRGCVRRHHASSGALHENADCLFGESQLFIALAKDDDGIRPLTQGMVPRRWVSRTAAGFFDLVSTLPSLRYHTPLVKETAVTSTPKSYFVHGRPDAKHVTSNMHAPVLTAALSSKASNAASPPSPVVLLGPRIRVPHARFGN